MAKALEEINDNVIYVGGAVVSYYITDTGAEQPRPTGDIDISVQIGSYAEMDKLREKLASKGIYPATDQKVMYRYEYEDFLKGMAAEILDSPSRNENIECQVNPFTAAERTLMVIDKLEQIQSI